MKMRKKNLSTPWVDYKKAFDSVPHSWILKRLEIYKISPKMNDFIKASMTKWKTTLREDPIYLLSSNPADL